MAHRQLQCWCTFFSFFFFCIYKSVKESEAVIITQEVSVCVRLINERLRLYPFQTLVNYWDDKSASFQKLPVLMLSNVWWRLLEWSKRTVFFFNTSNAIELSSMHLPKPQWSSSFESELFFFWVMFDWLKARCRWMVTHTQSINWNNSSQCIRASATGRYAAQVIRDASVCADEHIFLITKWTPELPQLGKDESSDTVITARLGWKCQPGSCQRVYPGQKVSIRISGHL